MSRVPSDLPLHVEAEGLLAITYHWDGQSRVWDVCAPCEYSDVVQVYRGMFPSDTEKRDTIPHPAKPSTVVQVVRGTGEASSCDAPTKNP